MIPKKINAHHIKRAMAQIEESGIPRGRNSRKFFIQFHGELFPAKYVLALALEIAFGKELDHNAFSGGAETVRFLTRLGFEIVAVRPDQPPTLPAPKEPHATSHPPNCRECKRVLIQAIKDMFGEVIPNWVPEIPTRPLEFRGSSAGAALQRIHSALVKLRGHENFIRRRRLPPGDLFVKSLSCLVEFDENQHFSQPRKVALGKYPRNLRVGFSIRRWKELCDQIGAHDSSPIYRDEQRAWYDTLRDFLPLIAGLNPTIRIRMGEFPWCQAGAQDPATLTELRVVFSQVWHVSPEQQVGSSGSGRGSQSRGVPKSTNLPVVKARLASPGKEVTK